MKQLLKAKKTEHLWGIDWRWEFRQRGHLLVSLSVILFIAGFWIYETEIAGVPFYIIPSPRRVFEEFLASMPANEGGIWATYSHVRNVIFTLQTAVLGFTIGVIAGLISGVLISEFKWFEKAFLPYINALQSLPKIALAPLLMIWLGIGIMPKIMLAALLTYFPILINTRTGLMNTDPQKLELMRSLLAGRWQIFWKVKMPSALPLIFTGLQMSIVYCLLGTMLAEYLSASLGIGMMIRAALANMDTAAMFSMMILLATTGFLLQTIMRFIRRRVVFWERGIDISST